jgi:hypothetical protein
LKENNIEEMEKSGEKLPDYGHDFFEFSKERFSLESPNSC